MSVAYCACGQRLDSYEELLATGSEMDRYIADMVGPDAFFCAEEDDVVPREWVRDWRDE
jgi:hypothetical protein